MFQVLGPLSLFILKKKDCKGICTQQEGSNVSNLDEVVVSVGVKIMSFEQNIYRQRTHLEIHEYRPTWKWSEVTFPSGLSL